MTKLTDHLGTAIVEHRLKFRKLTQLEVDFSNGTTSRFSAAALARVIDPATRIVTANVSAVVTAANQESRINLMSGAGAARTFTLPFAVGSGNVFRFYVGEVNTSGYFIKSGRGADIMRGQILQTNSGSAGATRGWYPGATDDTITLNGTTIGGASVGDWVELIDVAVNTWLVNGLVTATGTVATPFFDTVA